MILRNRRWLQIPPTQNVCQQHWLMYLHPNCASHIYTFHNSMLFFPLPCQRWIIQVCIAVIRSRIFIPLVRALAVWEEWALSTPLGCQMASSFFLTMDTWQDFLIAYRKDVGLETIVLLLGLFGVIYNLRYFIPNATGKEESNIC